MLKLAGPAADADATAFEIGETFLDLIPKPVLTVAGNRFPRMAAAFAVGRPMSLFPASVSAACCQECRRLAFPAFTLGAILVSCKMGSDGPGGVLIDKSIALPPQAELGIPFIS